MVTSYTLYSFPFSLVHLPVTYFRGYTACQILPAVPIPKFSSLYTNNKNTEKIQRNSKNILDTNTWNCKINNSQSLHSFTWTLLFHCCSTIQNTSILYLVIVGRAFSIYAVVVVRTFKSRSVFTCWTKNICLVVFSQTHVNSI